MSNTLSPDADRRLSPALGPAQTAAQALLPAGAPPAQAASLRPLPTATRPALAAALDATAHCGPEDDAGLANHLPMVLHALDELGADAARLERQLARALPRFSRPVERLPPRCLVVWAAQRGEPAAYPALAAHFEADLAARGAAPVLREALPLLVDGLATAAFHGLIRTAHAVEAGHRPELARALAHWASRWRTVPRPAGLPSMAWGKWVGALDAADSLPRPGGRMITERIMQVVAGPVYARLAGRLRIDAGVLRRLSLRAARAYARDRDFTRLHLVTSARALRVLSPWFADPADTVGRYADAFAAAWLASGGPVGPAQPDRGRSAAVPTSPAEWPRLAAEAIACDDDHLIKLVHACRDEAAGHNASVYRRCAATAFT